MNAIALFLTLVLYGNPTCQHAPGNEITVNGSVYAVQTYQCFWRDVESHPSHTFEVWSPVCQRYVDQPILIRERHVKAGWVMNRYGEFYPATHDVDVMEIHRPPCGNTEGLEGNTVQFELSKSPVMRLRKDVHDGGPAEHR